MFLPESGSDREPRMSIAQSTFVDKTADLEKATLASCANELCRTTMVRRPTPLSCVYIIYHSDGDAARYRL